MHSRNRLTCTFVSFVCIVLFAVWLSDFFTKFTLNYSYSLLVKDWKILSIMSARRADQVNRDKMAEDAHKLWEAEKNQRIRASQAHELQHWQTLARNRWKQEQQKVGTFAVLYCAVVTPAKEDMFLSLFVCLSVSNFVQKLPNGFGRNFRGRLAVGQ